MATTTPQRARPEGPGPETELPLYRLHLMRAGYALMGIGLAIVRWPDLITHPDPWPLMDSVVVCMLTAMSLLALLGLRYPVKLLPILLFEVAWKLLWLGVVALPRMLAGDMDAATVELVFSCSFVVLILVVIPWRYVWDHYATAPGDRWR
ncbi:hypothetical protein ACH9EU_08270 [Kocuria sp. M1R5S2]|uniref:hypothetical protein n=1 Tax=Kocuria rhizosphaerae TaxID=3376285 RepID=UPI0037B9E601